MKKTELRPILPDEKFMQLVLDKCNKDGTIFIPGEVPSKKNSQNIIYSKKHGRRIIQKSAFSQRYEKTCIIFYKQATSRFYQQMGEREFPLRVEFTLFRKTQQRFDYLNIGQMIQDMMVMAAWLPDDSSKFLIPSFAPAVHNPDLFGVWIKVL